MDDMHYSLFRHLINFGSSFNFWTHKSSGVLLDFWRNCGGENAMHLVRFHFWTTDSEECFCGEFQLLMVIYHFFAEELFG